MKPGAAVDRYALYEAAVQDPPTAVALIDTVFASRRTGLPETLREDFCGTGLLALHWAEQGRWAVGVDRDPDPVGYGLARAARRPGAAARCALRIGDVRTVRLSEKFDVAVAFNFSYCALHTRRDLVRYFRNVRRSLHPEGLFLLDVYGGPDAQYVLTEQRECPGFTYEWEQASFDPISHRTVCHIHFRLDDGREVSPAFTYDWRLWTFPELRDALAEAGFGAVDAWFDEDDGTDAYALVERTTNMEAWVAYAAAWNAR